MELIARVSYVPAESAILGVVDKRESHGLLASDNPTHFPSLGSLHKDTNKRIHLQGIPSMGAVMS